MYLLLPKGAVMYMICWSQAHRNKQRTSCNTTTESGLAIMMRRVSSKNGLDFKVKLITFFITVTAKLDRSKPPFRYIESTR
jgi:hypothetical protein